MDFDFRNDKSRIPYAYVGGNGHVVFIKAGKGGSYSGYADKYLRIARGLNERYGYTVICVSNPTEECETLTDADILAEVTATLGIDSPSISLMGVSNGGVRVLQLASTADNVRRILLVNMPLMINFHKTKKYLEGITGARTTLLYGERDPSFPYLAFIENKHLSHVDIITAPNADHNFTDMTDELVATAIEALALE